MKFSEIVLQVNMHQLTETDFCYDAIDMHMHCDAYIMRSNVNCEQWARVNWWLSIVVRPPVLAGELSLSCARLTAGRVTTLWVKSLLCSQPTWPTQPAIPPGSVK